MSRSVIVTWMATDLLLMKLPSPSRMPTTQATCSGVMTAGLGLPHLQRAQRTERKRMRPPHPGHSVVQYRAS